MKNILFLIAFFAFFTASAQEIDSSWIFNRAGLFYESRLQVFGNGMETITTYKIGDTTISMQVLSAKAEAEALQYAALAESASQLRKRITEMARYYRNIQNVIGRNPLDSFAKKDPTLYLTGYWQLNGTPIRFRRTASNFQYRADTSATWREMTYLRSVIRLNNLNGYTTDLFKTGNNQRYRNINNQYELRPVSDNSSSRNSIAPPPTESEEMLPPKLNPDGTVTISGTIMKYNSRKKKWEQSK